MNIQQSISRNLEINMSTLQFMSLSREQIEYVNIGFRKVRYETVFINCHITMMKIRSLFDLI